MVSTNGTELKQTVKEQRYEQRRQARQDAHQARQNYDKVLVEFQPDAVEIENRSVPGGVRWTLYAVIGLICACVAWSFWAQVDQIVVAQGKLITTVPAVLIDTKLASPIRSIKAQFGDRVVAGQELATLDPTFSDADVKRLVVKKNLLVALRTRLKAEQENKDLVLGDHQDDRDWLMQYEVFLERKNEYAAKLNEFTAENSKLAVQQTNTQAEIEFHKQNYDDFFEYEKDIRRLAKRGSKSETDVLSRKMQTNDAAMKVLQSQSRALELEKEIESLRTRKDAFLATWRAETVSKLVEAHEKFVEIEQDLEKAQQSNSFVSICVPDSLPYKDFVVIEVSDNSVGSVMEPGEPLFKLIPMGVSVEAEVEVAGKDIARLREASQSEIESGNLPNGSEVRVKLDSFPFQKHGTLNGVIRKISEDSFVKESNGGPAPTMYKARVQLLEPIKMDNVPDNFRLIPGMTATAEIKVGRRRVIEYFLYPLLRYLDTSIREP
jgi:hemolysin D